MNKIPNDILSAMRGLKPGELNTVRSFIFFLRTKTQIDPAQAYFWTRRWQALEQEAARDKKRGKIIGDGSLDGLLQSLRS